MAGFPGLARLLAAEERLRRAARERDAKEYAAAQAEVRRVIGEEVYGWPRGRRA